MVIYFAGQGCHIENIERMKQEKSWGVLLTYKDMAPKVDGNKRYRLLLDKMEENKQLKKKLKKTWKFKKVKS